MHEGEFGQATPGYWRWLGRIRYEHGVDLQTAYRDRILGAGAPDCLFLLEHEPVITLGRHADRGNILSSPQSLAAEGISVVQTSRGGDVTYHGPGQLVGYPVFRIRRGVRRHMQDMAEAIRDVLLGYGVRGEWRSERPGLWVDDAKICSFGVHVRRRVAVHGFALNVQAVKQGFAHIIPCGLNGVRIASIEDFLSESVAVADVAALLPAAFSRQFNLTLQPMPCSMSEFPQ